MYQNFHKGFDLTLIYINVGLILPSKDSWYIPGPCAGSEEVLVENSNSGEKRSFFFVKIGMGLGIRKITKGFFVGWNFGLLVRKLSQ